jgi:branched-subunit amino acid transport protein
MIESSHWIAVLGLVAITAITRSAFFLTDRLWPFPQWLESGLRYAPIGALAAVAVPAVLMTKGQLPSDWVDPKVVAAAAAALIAWWRKDMLLTIAVGMVVFHVWHWIA